MEKYELLPQQLMLEGTISEDQFFQPTPLKMEELVSTHTTEFLDKLEQQTLNYHEIRKIGFPMRPELIIRGKHIAGGTYQGALMALKNKGAAMNIAGGTHHSYADHGEGFCVFNDIALASNLLLNTGRVKKILIVDLDVHQGNGNAHIFQHDQRVFTFSMHGEKNYPLKKEQSDLDIGLPDGMQDKDYLQILYSKLPELIQLVEPDIIFYQSGVDIIEFDKLGRLGVSIDGCKNRDRFVFEQAHINQIPIVTSMGGGYSPEIKHIIEAHANTYREAMYFFG
ncbi:MAG: histone deacetylase [Bacteroidota bacterium]|nr:histone deacetylase [Bacteroidota bacterium]